MIHRRFARLFGLLVSLIVLATACTGSSDAADSSTTTTTDSDSSPVTIDSLATFIDTCRTEMLQAEPDIARLAIDPTLTNLTLGLLADEVPEAAAELHKCLGEENAARYLATDLIIAGQLLPDGVAECFEPKMAVDGDALLEVGLRWTRLESSDPSIGQTFIDVMLECVPGSMLAAPIRTGSPEGYAASVDESCLDEAHLDDPEPLSLFWDSQVYNRSGTGENDWTDAQIASVVAPLYACINTGDFIAADPNIGVGLSAATRNCFSEVAAGAGYWESRVAQAPFDSDAYQLAADDCLTPEEALVVLGIPLPVDDPEASNFAAVTDCYAEASIGSGDSESLIADLAELDDSDAAALIEELAACAGTEGVAGHYAATEYNNRALPAGTYDCVLGTAPTDNAEWLSGILHVEAGREVAADAGAAYIASLSECVPANIYTRPVLRDYSTISSAVDAACIDEALPSGSEAATRYWSALVFGASDSDGAPTAEATAAVEPIYSCVNAGEGFARLVATEAGADLPAESRDCIDQSTMAVGPIETALVGGTLAEGAFNGAIADCLSDEDVEAIQGG